MIESSHAPLLIGDLLCSAII